MKAKILISICLVASAHFVTGDVFARPFPNEFLKLTAPTDDEPIYVNQEALAAFLNEESSIIPQPEGGLTNPQIYLVNFDDVPWDGGITAHPISPNRYPGVSFYAPYTNSFTFTAGYSSSYISFPNHLIVGSINQNWVEHQTPLHIDFAQKTEHVSFYLYLPGCQNALIDIYEHGIFQQTIPIQFSSFETWKFLEFDSFSHKITRLRVRYNCPPAPIGFPIWIDDVSFQPNPSYNPIGFLDGVDQIGSEGAFGWSVDPDSPSESNNVDCYVDGVAGTGEFVGRFLANDPSPDVPYPGNHRFSMAVPIGFRDNNQHSVYCYGLDITGGDPPTLLTGSPRTFRFQTPVGYLDLVDSDGNAVGWTVDPTVPTQSNSVHFYVDGPAGSGTFAGEVVANNPRPDVPYPGNHGFSFRIPDQFRDGQQHTIYAHGIDLSGDQATLLSGSPKTFNLMPKVESLVFEAINNESINGELTSSELDTPSGSSSLRIYPDRKVPNDTVNHRRVRVRAVVSPAVQGAHVYFKNFDVDDPSADPIIDDNGNEGFDNRERLGIGYPYPPSAAGSLSATSAVTDANGEAIVYFTVTKQPGDNFVLAASTNQLYLNGIEISGTGLSDSTNNPLPTTDGKRTDLLTVWRKIYLEVDSMGNAGNNLVNGYIDDSIEINNDPVWLRLSPAGTLDDGRFRATYKKDGTFVSYGGRLVIGNVYNLAVLDNTSGAVLVRSEAGPVEVQMNQIFALFDDDDFNDSEEWWFTWHGDDGEDIRHRGSNMFEETFSRLRPSDIAAENPFAAAYIVPDYSWAAQQPGMNDMNVPFEINVQDDRLTVDYNRDTMNMDSRTIEKDDFWIGYLLIGYQESDLPMLGLNRDADPYDLTNPNDVPFFGVAPCDNSQEDLVDTTASSYGVHKGCIGALLLIETMRDANTLLSSSQLMTNVAPHELGHQFGIRGDKCNFGIMSPTTCDNSEFIPQHINIMRWRVSSPGEFWTTF